MASSSAIPASFGIRRREQTGRVPGTAQVFRGREVIGRLFESRVSDFVPFRRRRVSAKRRPPGSWAVHAAWEKAEADLERTRWALAVRAQVRSSTAEPAEASGRNHAVLLRSMVAVLSQPFGASITDLHLAAITLAAFPPPAPSHSLMPRQLSNKRIKDASGCADYQLHRFLDR
jgi:hypothetical protein